MNASSRAVVLCVVTALSASGVTPVDASGLITPARYFNLEGKTIRFQPSGQGYFVAVSKIAPAADRGSLLGLPSSPSYRSRGWRVALPFAFRFAGNTWHDIFVNSAGNLTFERPEADLYPERDTWAAGTVQMVADSINSRAAAGQEKMICAFWGLNSPESRVYVRENLGEFVVTWQVERYIWFGEGYRPLGTNHFQARLTPDGAIEFSYYKVAEKDGIVGVFPGGGEYHSLDSLVAPDNAPDPRVALQSVDAATSGKVIRFTFVSRNPIPDTVSEGRLWYRVYLKNGNHRCEVGYQINPNPSTNRPFTSNDCDRTPGINIEGNRLNLYVSASMMTTFLVPGMEWSADVVWDKNRKSHLEHSAGDRPFHPSDQALVAPPSGAVSEGNIYDVFNYPQVDKDILPLLRYIYQRFKARDDFAVVLTDFRIDDLHNHQVSRGGFNVAIHGIGERLDQVDPARSAQLTGSSKLQVATGPIYLGPRFDEFLEDGGRHYKNYANAVGWMAHELTHRWGMALQFRNDGRSQALAEEGGHWVGFLNTASLNSVWKMFSDQPYSEKSQMEGYVFHELPGGEFRREPAPWNLPTGFSALDLYAMGMIGASEVPDTYLIRDAVETGPDLYRGQKVPVRIQDIIAALGPRVPNFRAAQKKFTLGMYLLHEGGRPPDPEKLHQAEGIEKSLIAYFQAATGGRMHVVASRPEEIR